MSKKLSIIRFKPKPEHYDDFLNGRHRKRERERSRHSFCNEER
jgi:hypothetical protein